MQDFWGSSLLIISWLTHSIHGHHDNNYDLGTNHAIAFHLPTYLSNLTQILWRFQSKLGADEKVADMPFSSKIHQFVIYALPRYCCRNFFAIMTNARFDISSYSRKLQIRAKKIDFSKMTILFFPENCDSQNLKPFISLQKFSNLFRN